jgi:2-polyprenyl-3-methyl-5-hydroxy-6-metoxy-1,4-benzoquinol methylase
MSTLSPTRQAQEAGALSSRLFLASLGCAELMTIYIGLRLGLYERLSAGPATPASLAEDAQIAPRYARVWLEQQAVSGMLKVSGVDRPPGERLYRLPRGHADALLDPDSPSSVAPLALLPIGGMSRVLPDLLRAFKSGGGVPYAAYGEDLRGGQSGLNRPVFVHHLAEWVRTAMPDVHERLQRPGARIADVACGVGWSTIALASAYPGARVDGVDLDEPSIREARENARQRDLGDRIRFHATDIAERRGRDSYDLVCVCDALHDMARPVDVLAACRAVLAPKGSMLLMEPRVLDDFCAPADELERFMYAISVLHCLPVGLSEQPSAATGTVMRSATVRDYARRAGFTAVTVLDVEHRFHRLYRLDP